MARPPHEIIQERLAVYLGPHTSKSAVKTFAEKNLGIPPEQVTLARAKELIDALRPMLKTLVGAAKCDKVLSQIMLELDLRQ